MGRSALLAALLPTTLVLLSRTRHNETLTQQHDRQQGLSLSRDKIGTQLATPPRENTKKTTATTMMIDDDDCTQQWIGLAQAGVLEWNNLDTTRLA
jgi:hypothetical protein